MATPILPTKLYRPLPQPTLLRRPRLLTLLNEGIRGKLTLISAPAGFGKTTLASSWVNEFRAIHNSSLGTRTAWLSLDEGESDPFRFVAYLIAALQTVAPRVGERVLGALQASQSARLEPALTTFLNELAALPAQQVLVLDDYHAVDSPQVDRAMAFMLEHLPPQLHLVMATREDPNLPLARLRSRGELTEVRAADLRFTPAESADFLNRAMGLTLTTAEIEALEARTEGWIAGLQLAAISMRGRHDTTRFIQSFTGSNRFVMDYLVEEVLQQQPAGVQSFLLRTSILDRLSGPLCDAVVRDPHAPGHETLAGLERANLFLVPLDEERRWYRYHHLFADLLRQRLGQQAPALGAELHSRASAWYEAHNFVDEAIEHALRAGDFVHAARQIERIAEAVWMSSIDTRLRRWLGRLPLELVATRPQLGIFHAWYLLAAGKQAEADEMLDRVAAALEADGSQNSVPGPDAMRGRLAVLRAFSGFYRGDGSAIIHHAGFALANLPKDDLAWRSTAAHLLGDAYDFSGQMAKAYAARLDAVAASRASGNAVQILIANLKLAIVLQHMGQLSQVVEICREQFDFAKANGMAHTVIGGWLLAIWGEALAELNRLPDALAKAEAGVALAEAGGDVAMLGWSYLCLIRVRFAMGDWRGATAIVQKVEDLARQAFVPPWIMDLSAAWQARIWLVQEKLERVERWAETRGVHAQRIADYGHEPENLIFARLFVARGRVAEAMPLLQRQLDAAEGSSRTLRAIEILCLQALALKKTDNSDGALATLARALALAEAGDCRQLFLDEGPPMTALLQRAVARRIRPDFARRLLAAVPATAEGDGVAAAPSARPPGLIEPLSERELEVLSLIAEGHSNQEIGRHLFIALDTVKGHNRRIFGKLQVRRRTEAVARARLLGLL